MTLTRTYPVWCRAADLVLLRTIGERLTPYRVEFRQGERCSFPLDLDDFTTGASDYDIISDEIYGPCGDTLPGWDGTAGHLLRLIYQHCETSGHPKPRYEP